VLMAWLVRTPIHARSRISSSTRLVCTKVKFPKWVLLMQMAVALQGGATVRTRVNHGEAVKVALLVRGGMGFQGFDDEPLVEIGLAYLSSEHVISFSSAPLR